MSYQPKALLYGQKRRPDLKIRDDMEWDLTSDLIYFLKKRLHTVPKVSIHNPQIKHMQDLGLDIFLTH